MSTQPDAGPVGRLLRVWEWIAVLHEGSEDFVYEMRVRAAVTCALGETEMSFLR